MEKNPFFDIFSHPLLMWFQEHGRKNLPWQHPRTPYRVWISEIMLQQTQVQTVIPYFERFMAQFPSPEILAESGEEAVLTLWAGLGYYSRARNLYKTALKLKEKNFTFPTTAKELVELPGIGPSTAAAISAQCFDEASPILDGNVIRVLSRFFKVEGYYKETKIKNKLWKLAKDCMPNAETADYTQAIMDLGATCCTLREPLCTQCPLSKNCGAFQADTVLLYPEKPLIKPKRPIKNAIFMVLYDGENRILLRKRPSKGLWGGLWCLPHIEQEEEPVSFLLNQYGVKVIHHDAILKMQHQFTHFQLNITARSFYIGLSPLLSIENYQWFHQEEVEKLALPKPVLTITRAFFKEKLQEMIPHSIF